jgi:hypothetical protein
MPGLGVKYVFKGKPPKLFTAVFCLLLANFLASVIVGETRKTWEEDSSPLGDRIVAALSWYDSRSITVQFVLLGIGFLVAFLYRKQMVRVPVPSAGDRPASLLDVVIATVMAPAACGFVGALVAGAIYFQVDRVWGLGIAALVVLIAVWTTDRLIFSFPDSERFRKRRKVLWIWAAIVTSAVLWFMMSEFSQ